MPPFLSFLAHSFLSPFVPKGCYVRLFSFIKTMQAHPQAMIPSFLPSIHSLFLSSYSFLDPSYERAKPTPRNDKKKIEKNTASFSVHVYSLADPCLHTPLLVVASYSNRREGKTQRRLLLKAKVSKRPFGMHLM